MYGREIARAQNMLEKGFQDLFAHNRSHGSVEVRALVELNEMLRKATVIGYQTVSTGGGTYAPLVPQSIEQTLSTVTFSEKDVIVLWPMIPKGSASQTVHEYARIVEHGQDVDPFISEGGGGTTNKPVLDKEFLRIRYMAERREPTDVATMVGILGMTPEVLAFETQEGTTHLLWKIERAILHSKAALSALHFDGIIEQIRTKAPGNVTDLRGALVTPQLIQYVLGELNSAPRHGNPDVILVEGRIHTVLVNYASQFGRHNQMTVGSSNAPLTFGPQGLQFAGPMGMVPIKIAPLLFHSYPAPSAASSGDAPAAPALTAFGINSVAAPVASSQWVAADAGEYIYKFVAVSVEDEGGGFSTPLTTAATAVVAGGSINAELNNANGVSYYRVYRSEKNGAADTCKHIIDLPINVLGANGKTLFIDKNDDIPDTSSILFLRMDPRQLQFVRLLDLVRRPLAEVKTTKPFLLMLFGAVAVKTPTKFWELRNCGAPKTVNLVQAP